MRPGTSASRSVCYFLNIIALNSLIHPIFSRIFRIFEGANDVLRLFVALTGMQFAGKQLMQTLDKAKSGDISTIIGEFKRRTFGERFSLFC